MLSRVLLCLGILCASSSHAEEGPPALSPEQQANMEAVERAVVTEGAAPTVDPTRPAGLRWAARGEDGTMPCALTFDDGPREGTSMRLLGVLQKEQVAATYYPVIAQARHMPDVVRAFIAAGIEIGDHTMDHPDLVRLDPAARRAQIANAQEWLKGLGANVTLFRPPYGRFDSSIVQIARELGMRTTLWTVDSRDWKRSDSDSLFQRVGTTSVIGPVVLMHATHEGTVEALPRIIASLRGKGCRFVTMTEWLRETDGLPAAPKFVAAAKPPALASWSAPKHSPKVVVPAVMTTKAPPRPVPARVVVPAHPAAPTPAPIVPAVRTVPLPAPQLSPLPPPAPVPGSGTAGPPTPITPSSATIEKGAPALVYENGRVFFRLTPGGDTAAAARQLKAALTAGD